MANHACMSDDLAMKSVLQTPSGEHSVDMLVRIGLEEVTDNRRVSIRSRVDDMMLAMK